MAAQHITTPPCGGSSNMKKRELDDLEDEDKDNHKRILLEKVEVNPVPAAECEDSILSKTSVAEDYCKIDCSDNSDRNPPESNQVDQKYVLTDHNYSDLSLTLGTDDSNKNDESTSKNEGKSVLKDDSISCSSQRPENDPQGSSVTTDICKEEREMDISVDFHPSATESTQEDVDTTEIVKSDAAASGSTPSSPKAGTSSNVILPPGIGVNEIDEIIEGLSDEINSMLELRAEKTNLTVKNVKSILRHVITNEYVLAMVRNTMRMEEKEDGELEEAVYEPKLTRSKAKELRKKQAMLPWPVSSPAKEKSKLVSKNILEEHFSDDEGSSDEEYNPNDECHSDDDDAPSSPKASSSRSSVSEDKSSSSPEKNTHNDSGSEMSPLFIAEETPEVTDMDVMTSQTEADLIALRTRSKLPLTDTLMETLEASFIAPDITEDMYDTECDDEEWSKFLMDIIKPLDTKINVEQQDDDAEDDPEYNILEDYDDAHDQWERKAAKISQKELDALLAEILEAADQELNDMEDEKEEEFLKEIESPLPIVQPEKVIYTLLPEELASIDLTQSDRLMLEEQMRMHVQLLTQTYLLGNGIREFSNMSHEVLSNLEELKMLSSQSATNPSSFYAHNLDGALTIVNDFKAQNITPPKSATRDRKMFPMRNNVQETMAHSRVFIYPDLLPTRGYRNPSLAYPAKCIFTLAEDCLVALGLEEFSFSTNPIRLIQKLLLPGKTEVQIRNRIKNCRGALFKDNPITYFHKHRKAPLIPRHVRPFDPANVKPPCELSSDLLPKWMAPFSVNQVRIAPAPSLKKIAVVRPMVKNRKYRSILPRSYISPIKKISPILRKYRRTITIAPFNLTSPYVKPDGSSNKQPRRIVPIRPKPDPNAPDSITVFEHYSEIKPFKNENIRIAPATMVLTPIQAFGTQPNLQSTVTLSVTTSASELGCPSAQSVTAVNNSVGYCLPIVQPVSAIQHQDNLKNPQNIIDNALKAADIHFPLSCDSGAKQNINTDYPEIEKDNSAAARIGNEITGDMEDGEEEAVDDEQDLAALMAASSTICKKQHSTAKKKNKHQRDLESTLTLLSPHLMESDPKKEEREKVFAQSYLIRVMEALKDSPESCENFLKVIISYENSTKSLTQLYQEVQEILKGHPDLIDDFAGFLLPDQAKDCGKYIEYTTLSKIKLFLRKVEVHFSQQPHHIQRFMRTLSQLQNQTNLTSASVIAALQPLLRNQSHLLEEFLQLLPNEAPPECLMMDFEEMKIPNSDGENSSCDSVEDITIPEAVDPYGGKDCPCDCHLGTSDVRMQNRNRHCVKCGTKFLDGRIYIQTGKVLKPAQVVYHTTSDVNCNSNRTTMQITAETGKALTESPSSNATTGPNSNSCIPRTADDQVPCINIENRPSEKATSEQVNQPTAAGKASAKLQQKENTSPRVAKCHGDILHHAIAENLGPENCAPLHPCDMVEDAVLPPEPRGSLSYIPSDFSHLRDVISLEASSNKTNSTCSTNVISDGHNSNFGCATSSEGMRTSVTIVNTNPRTFFTVEKQGMQDQGEILDAGSSSLASQNQMEQIWTREQDKIILETCQRHGATQESFTIAAQAIKSRTVNEVVKMTKAANENKKFGRVMKTGDY